MTKEELIEIIIDNRMIYVMSKQRVPHYVAVNENTYYKLFPTKEIMNMVILIDDKLADDEFRLLRK